MEFTKVVVVPAALSEILGRIFSFLFDSFPRPSPPGGARDVHRRRLERLLGNIGSTVEEAEGRHITNQQLLAHLKALTDGMYRGRFALEVTDLDDVRNAVVGDDAEDDDAALVTNEGNKRSFALCSSFNAAKRARLTSLILRGGGGGSSNGATERRLAAVVEELEGLTRDYMSEFIMLVQGYPRKVHRPVTTTLYMDRCVFGRHVEKERVVDFLLRRSPAGRAPYLSALAVVGAKKVGKTTLVRHACDDERVRGHFARVEWFETPDVVRAGGTPGQTAWASDGPEYLAGVRRILDYPRGDGPSLLVFEDAWPVDEVQWAALASTPSRALAEGSKLLFTCRDADLARIGTAEPVVLGHLREEEYWYYFKAFAFGGADPRCRGGGQGHLRAPGAHVPGRAGAGDAAPRQLRRPVLAQGAGRHRPVRAQAAPRRRPARAPPRQRTAAVLRVLPDPAQVHRAGRAQQRFFSWLFWFWPCMWRR